MGKKSEASRLVTAILEDSLIKAKLFVAQQLSSGHVSMELKDKVRVVTAIIKLSDIPLPQGSLHNRLYWLDKLLSELKTEGFCYLLYVEGESQVTDVADANFVKIYATDRL